MSDEEEMMNSGRPAPILATAKKATKPSKKSTPAKQTKSTKTTPDTKANATSAPTTKTTTTGTSESPISKAMAAHLESLMQGDEADELNLGVSDVPALDLGEEAEEDDLDNDYDYTMDNDNNEEEEEAYEDAEDQIEFDPNTNVEPELEPISIPLTFSSSKNGGAWDDRDLVTAFDAAKEEFHLHNPGPGSWLDKTMAGLAKGKPLAGATYGETKWYTSYDPAEDPIVPRTATASSSNHNEANAGGIANGAGNGQGGKGGKGKKRKRANEGGGNANGEVTNQNGRQNNYQNQNQNQNGGQGKRVRIAPTPVFNPYLPHVPAHNTQPNPYLSGPTNTPFTQNQNRNQGQDGEDGYRPVLPEYQPTSPVYTPLSPTYQPDALDEGTGSDVIMSTTVGSGSGTGFGAGQGGGQGMDAGTMPTTDPFGRTIPSSAMNGGAGRSGVGTGGTNGMLGPIIPEDARSRSAATTSAMAGGRNGGAGMGGGKRLPNYAGLASPSPSPSAGRRLPQSQFNPSYKQQQQQQQRPQQYQPQQPMPAPPARSGPPQASRQDPTYDPTGSGVYPSMGMSGFTSGVEMNREVAVSRAVNAQWWAGYWFAMSEVLPPAEG